MANVIIITRDNSSKLGEPVPNQEVTIVNEGNTFTKVTDENGEAFFPNIPCEQYTATTIDNGIPYSEPFDCRSCSGTAYIRLPRL